VPIFFFHFLPVRIVKESVWALLFCFLLRICLLFPCFIIISKISSIGVYHLLHGSSTWWKQLGHILVPIQPVSTFIFLDSIVQVLLFGQYSFLSGMLFSKRKREIAIFLSK